MRTYLCSKCGKTYSITDRRFRCDCGGPFELKKEITLSREKISQRPPTMWRYREVIPIEVDKNIVTLGEGMTPLVDFKYKGLKLLAKLDYLSPTGSFKDRGASVLISYLKEIGVDRFIEDSSGNAGAAAAAYAAKAGLKCEIFCPDYASIGKVNQVLWYGAKLRRISGSRADTAKAVLEEAEETYYASHNWSPFYLEGLKTIAYEIVEQLGWKVPDVVVAPLGYGGLFTGLFIGFTELRQFGVVDRIPKLLGVQSQMCCPVYRAYQQNNTVITPMEQIASTLAEGVCATQPIHAELVMKAIRESGGAVTVVSEDEIVEGLRILSSQGIFVEPTSAIVVKAIDHFLTSGKITSEDNIVTILTGIGLKAANELKKFVENME